MTAPLRLLYVDDDPDIRTIVDMALALDPSMSVRMAASGAEAIAALRESDWRPDVIVLDVMMPDMDGLATFAAVRRLPGLDTVEVLFMTAKASEADLALYHARGANGAILKPFDPLQLATQIRTLIARPRSADAASLPS